IIFINEYFLNIELVDQPDRGRLALGGLLPEDLIDDELIVDRVAFGERDQPGPRPLEVLGVPPAVALLGIRAGNPEPAEDLVRPVFHREYEDECRDVAGVAQIQAAERPTALQGLAVDRIFSAFRPGFPLEPFL